MHDHHRSGKEARDAVYIGLAFVAYGAFVWLASGGRFRDLLPARPRPEIPRAFVRAFDPLAGFAQSRRDDMIAGEHAS